MSFSFFRTVCSFLLVVSLAAFAFGDTIHLKDGSIIKGKIVSFSGGTFTVAIGEGTRRRELKFAASDIESIDFDAIRPEFVNVSVPRTQEVTISTSTLPKVITTDTARQENPVEKKPEPTRPVTSLPSVKPIEISVKVLADNTANGWTNSGWVVKKGQRIRITGEGEVSLGGGKTTTASGLYDLEDPNKLLKSVPTGALLAVIGDDNNDFIYVGAEREFTASRDGTLFLGLNEGNLADNAGSFNVKIAIAPSEE
jgi:hypothetical protein